MSAPGMVDDAAGCWKLLGLCAIAAGAWFLGVLIVKGLGWLG